MLKYKHTCKSAVEIVYFINYKKFKNINRVRINNQIRARELRVIDQKGQNLGVLPLAEALQKAREAGLDLIEISPTANPPVAKITERGKYLYEQGKKERQARKKRKEVEIKTIRIGIGTGTHDLDLKAKQADKFLKEGNKIKVDLALRGREKYLKREFLEERLRRLLSLISEQFVEDKIQKNPRGISINISQK